ncbi:UDP-3-O-(3-hydroxymyristoyl)glucosamine N-acyltransferase [Geobacter sp. SVR]|uniref:UDP-3-O-(3-hydroxymyristoyl)glucosamine N-acyltransferase n=1 Tax=Geobacter sp. SVR TaxID=2495594 RepID=UPI00143EFB92|nr:UDP-3-O-(3-hydroxymyristoyl)glucosamine N-acyltransferase [Geobacter sp. SVR]BCS52434.1 UDP-3-O-acylglucosamine N-acyltransferase [Geobacter sp. SVR]GCF87335.1 UDP-3-O-acylglucosamine N-acyltransferase [Geobacter sp. SVR]
MTEAKTLKELADYLGGTVRGDEGCQVNGLAPLDMAGPDKVTFLANPKYASKVAETQAGAVLMAPGGEAYGRNVIEVSNPYLAFAKLLNLFYVQVPAPLGILPGASVAASATLGSGITVHPGAVIGEQVTIGNGCIIHPGAVVYAGVSIGAGTVIHANAVIRERCRIGNRCVIQPGAVIGSDGFGYAPDGNHYYPIPQIGIVVLEDDVEIGANTCIDRAALEVTLIRRGTKLDNLVQVAHNCQIGEDCMIVSQVGISGSTRIGNHVTLAGQVGVAGHLSIGDNVMVGAQSGIPGSLPANAGYSGTPAMPHKEWLKAMAIVPKLPELRKSITALEKRIIELEEQIRPA